MAVVVKVIVIFLYMDIYLLGGVGLSETVF